MDKEIKDALDKGLIHIAKESALKAHRMYEQLKILNYTREQTEADIFTCFLRTYRRN